MNAELLLQHFERLSEAPDAIPRLRRFILDLAVRGKLVEQNPNDEPATELLKRIQVEKARRIKLGEIRAARGEESIEEVEELFQLPSIWGWVRLSNLGLIIGGGTPPSGNLDNFADGGKDIPWLTPADLGKYRGLFISHGKRDLSQQGLAVSSATLMPTGSVLFTSRAPIGYTAIASNPITTNQGFKSVVPYITELSRFIALYFQAFAPWIDSKASGTTFREVSGKIVAGLPFPLPPLAEQLRIVAKVDELMGLCDQLEGAKTERELSRNRLVASSLQRLNQPAVDETFREDARFIFNHLPRLTTHPALIKQLRQTILNLAVRGKLVEQDTNDEPAAELLKRIQAEKVRLEKEGKTKREKLVEAIDDDTAPFAIPETWNWARLGDLTELITKGSSPKWQGIAYVSKDDGILFVTSENVGNYHLRKLDDLKYVEKRFNEIEPRSMLRSGDILMNLVGASIGRTAIYDLGDVANINQAVALIRLIQSTANMNPEFMLHYLNSPLSIQLMMASQVVTAQPNISLTNAREFPIPVPPLPEQQRIVSKVAELMALCDQLETQLTTTQANSRRLLEAVLHEALVPALEEAA